ncbi:rubredoxin-like domain-containing protein [Brassicibacter mesophilus]|jgi:rubrerythrin
MKTFLCKVCGHTATGEEPPMYCPICYAYKDEFVEIDKNDAPGY